MENPGDLIRTSLGHAIRFSDVSGLLLDALPGAFHVLLLRVGLPDTESKGEFAIEFGVREVEVAAAVQPIHEELRGAISGAQAEADQVELGGRGQFKAFIFIVA